MRAPFLALLVLSLAWAGCVSDDGAAPVETAGSPPGVVVGERPPPTYGDVAVGEGAAPDEEASLAEAPRLRVGEWWRIRMHSPLDGREAEYLRVLAAIDGDTYVFGMPHEGWYKEAVVYHVPFFGDVNLDLSGHAHDVPFVPLKFPLADGETWTTRFEGPPDLVATVDADEAARTAEVKFTDADGHVHVRLVYDAAIHEIRLFEHATVVYEVVEHGYGFEGWVTVPRGEDLVFFHGRAAGVVGIAPEGNAPNASPFEEVLVEGGFNRMSFILAVVDVQLGQPASPGAHRVKATAPDGTAYELSSLPHTGGFRVEFFEATDPDGLWQLEFVAAGVGAAFIEGIAYHQYDIKVPTGERRSDHNHPVVR